MFSFRFFLYSTCKILIFHHLKNCSGGVAASPADERSRGGADWAAAGSTGGDLRQLDDRVTLFYCNAGARQCSSASH